LESADGVTPDRYDRTAGSTVRIVLVAIGCASLATAFLAFFTPMPQAGYERLALPIAMAAADPSRFPATDLLVCASFRPVAVC